MEKEKFKIWLIRNGYSDNTTTSYSYAIDRISKHLSEKRNEKIDVYAINDLPTIKKLVESYSVVGNYSEVGNEGRGTVRNAIKKFYSYKENADDLSYELDDGEIENEELTDISITNFSYERDLKNSMVSQIAELFPEYKIFGNHNEGVEYLVEGKRIDLLLEKSDGELLAVELKSGVANFKVFGQLSMYLGLLMDRFPNKQIKGCIVAGEIDLTPSRIKEVFTASCIILIGCCDLINAVLPSSPSSVIDCSKTLLIALTASCIPIPAIPALVMVSLKCDLILFNLALSALLKIAIVKKFI